MSMSLFPEMLLNIYFIPEHGLPQRRIALEINNTERTKKKLIEALIPMVGSMAIPLEYPVRHIHLSFDGKKKMQDARTASMTE